MLGFSLPVALVALAAVVTAVTVFAAGRKGGARRLTAIRTVLAISTVVLPVAALTAGTPATAAPQERAAVPQQHPAPQEHVATMRYGPLQLPPYRGDDGGHGGHDGQMVSYVNPAYAMPCQNCYITGFQPDLVYADGSMANHDTGAMLHHLVLFDRSKKDATCGARGVGLLTGQRVFAAGNERTGAHLPPGYGYHLGATPLAAVTELMNMSAQPQQVYVTMRVSWVDAHDAHLKDVTPVWLDINNCGNSQYPVPAGPSHRTWTWKSTMAGDIVAVGGHVHDHGISITLSDATRNETICTSLAGYGSGSPAMAQHDMGHVESMSTCVGDPLATVAKGDDLAIDSFYDAPMPDDTVMGIMIAYLHEF